MMQEKKVSRDNVFISNHIILIIAVFTVISSCVKEEIREISSVKWNPDFSFPLGETSLRFDESYGFADDLFQIDSVTNLPNWVQEEQITLYDTLPFDLRRIISRSEEINRLMFRFNTANYFPATLITQVYFTDLEENVLDSLFQGSSYELLAANVKDGNLVGPFISQVDVVFPKERMELLNDVRIAMLKMVLVNESPDVDLIGQYELFKVDIQIGVQVNFTVDSDNLTGGN